MTWFRNLRLATQLILAFVLVGLISVVTGGLGLRGTAVVSGLMGATSDNNVVSIYEFLQIRFGVATRNAASAVFLVTRLLASGTRDPLLCERGGYEVPFIEQVQKKLAVRHALLPWLARIPVGQDGLSMVIG